MPCVGRRIAPPMAYSSWPCLIASIRRINHAMSVMAILNSGDRHRPRSLVLSDFLRFFFRGVYVILRSLSFFWLGPRASTPSRRKGSWRESSERSAKKPRAAAMEQRSARRLFGLARYFARRPDEMAFKRRSRPKMNGRN